MQTRISSCVVVALLLGTGAGHAQGISLTPDIGIYVPTSTLIGVASGQTSFPSEQEVSISVGGKLDIWFTDRVGIQGTGTYAPSELSFGLGGVGSPRQANVFFGSGRLSYYVVPRTRLVSFMVTGGVGWVKRSGDAYAGVEDTADWTGTMGAALGIRLGPILSVRLSGETYVYKPDFVSDTGVDPSTQNDFNVSLGLGIPLLMR